MRTVMHHMKAVGVLVVFGTILLAQDAKAQRSYQVTRYVVEYTYVNGTKDHSTLYFDTEAEALADGARQTAAWNNPGVTNPQSYIKSYKAVPRTETITPPGRPDPEPPGFPSQASPPDAMVPSSPSSKPSRFGFDFIPVTVDGRLGFQVVSVTPGGAAARSGLEPGDVIVGIDGVASRDSIGFYQRLAAVGSLCRLNVKNVRTGGYQIVTVAPNAPAMSTGGPASRPNGVDTSWRNRKYYLYIGRNSEASNLEGHTVEEAIRVARKAADDNSQSTIVLKSANGSVLYNRPGPR